MMLIREVIVSYLAACPEIRGTQRAVLIRLQNERGIGTLNAKKYTPHNILAYAERRSKTVKPVTIAADIGYLRTALDYAEVGLGIVGVSGESIRKAMPILKQKQMVGSSGVRDRIPTPQEHADILAYVRRNDPNSLNAEVIDYEYHSGRRISEACRHKWGQFDEATKTIFIENLKHPRKKVGYNKRAALIDEAFAIIVRQKRMTNDPEERIFKANSKTVGGVYTRACKALGITGLQMKDSRAGVVTRLLKGGYTPQEVQLVTVNGIGMINNVYNRMKGEDFPRRPS